MNRPQVIPIHPHRSEWHLEYVINRIGDPFLAPFEPGHRIYWLYLCAALAIALAVFLLGDGRGAGFSVRRFLRYRRCKTGQNRVGPAQLR